MTRLLLAIALVLQIAFPAAAGAVTDEIMALGYTQSALALTPAAPTTTRTIVVDATPSFSVDVLAASQTLRVALVAPDGVRHAVGDPASPLFESGFFPIDATATTRAGASYLISINDPLAGDWTLEVGESGSLTAPLDLLVSTFVNNQLRLVLAGGGDTFPLGRDVRLALVAFDGGTRLSGLSIDGRLFRPFDPTFAPQGVAFRDDGAGADETAGDGIYEGFVNVDEPGDYQVQVDATGVGSTGPFRRTAATTLRLVGQDALISGVADRGLDANHDGLYESVGVTASANVGVAGDYVVTALLRASNGHELLRSARGTFGLGAGSAEVLFAAGDVIRDLGVDGPYQVAELRYAQVRPDDIVPVDVRYDLGSTAAYALGQLQRPRLRLGGGSAVGVDLNGNGRYDRLDVGLDLVADFAGFYSFSCSLTDANGRELGFRSGSLSLVAGSNTLGLSFPARPIGENGVDGPYFVSNLIVFGAGQSLIETTAFATPPLRASQFEGFVADTTPPTVTVTATPNQLWPANHQLVEIAADVSATDDFDPSPAVQLASITSNQAANDRGDGNTEPDVVVENGRIFLRAERSGTARQDRVYTIVYRATDLAGNVGTGSAVVTVPHDRGRS
jgi:hypothetical protein